MPNNLKKGFYFLRLKKIIISITVFYYFDDKKNSSGQALAQNTDDSTENSKINVLRRKKKLKILKIVINFYRLVYSSTSWPRCEL